MCCAKFRITWIMNFTPKVKVQRRFFRIILSPFKLSNDYHNHTKYNQIFTCKFITMYILYISPLFNPFCKVCLNFMFTSDLLSIFEGHWDECLKHMMTASPISWTFSTKQININLCYREKKLMKQNFRLWLKMIFYSKKNQ